MGETPFPGYYPASYPTVLSLAAVDCDGVRAPFSQANAQVDIAAPGVAVLSTAPPIINGIPTPPYAAQALRERLPAETGRSKQASPPPQQPMVVTGPRAGSLAPPNISVSQAPERMALCGFGDAPCANVKGNTCIVSEGSTQLANNCGASVQARGPRGWGAFCMHQPVFGA